MADLLDITMDTRGAASIDGLDALMERFPALGRRAVNSALASEGLRLKKVLQTAIKAGGPSGAKWPPAHPWSGILKQSRRAGSWFNPKARSKTAGAGNPLLKFWQGVRYVVDKDKMEVSTGFVNPNVRFAEYLSKAETGFETPVTPKMRRLFFGLGLGLRKDTSRLKSPARPLIGPVWSAEQGTTAAKIERKFFANLERYWSEEKA